MKIRRFVAKDMRNALLQIKEELGADAVIMSQKKIPEGVELMAAVDYSQSVQATSDESAINEVARDVENDVVSIGKTKNNIATNQQASNNSHTAPADSLSALLNRKVQVNTDMEKSTNKTSQIADSNIEQQFKSFTDRLEQNTVNSNNNESLTDNVSPVRATGNNSQQNNQHDSQQSYQQEKQTSIHDAPQKSVQVSMSSNSDNHASNAEIEQMRQEMSSIRQLLEHQVSGLMWQDMAQKDPSKALMVNRLMALGLNEQVAEQIAGYIPAYDNEQQAWEHAKQLLAQQLNTTNNDIIHRGGVVSLVGPTGVGKTTTIAKLAARFAQIHGADQVVMISTDNYRIAGFEQLSTYGRIIGCQVKLAKDAQSLDALLQQYSQKKLVLIDTAGMGQRDMRLAEHLTTLISNSRVRIRNYLVLAANTQQRVMQENVDRFKKVPLAGCIYTKLDESLSVGEIIATSIQNGLAIGYLTDGQRVPEDIKVANAEKLVTLADRLSVKINKQNTWRPMPMKATAVA